MILTHRTDIASDPMSIVFPGTLDSCACSLSDVVHDRQFTVCCTSCHCEISVVAVTVRTSGRTATGTAVGKGGRQVTVLLCDGPVDVLPSP